MSTKHNPASATPNADAASSGVFAPHHGAAAPEAGDETRDVPDVLPASDEFGGLS